MQEEKLSLAPQKPAGHTRAAEFFAKVVVLSGKDLVEVGLALL